MDDVLHDVFGALESLEDRDTPDIARAFAEQEHDASGTPDSEGAAKAALEIAFTAGMLAARRALNVHRWWEVPNG